jgi:hypothetical protein
MSEELDLRPWGWAPGFYCFKCKDCPEPDNVFMNGALGAKRSIRCQKHAMEARERALSTPPPPLHREPIEADRELYLKLGIFHTCEDRMILAGWADDSKEMQEIVAHRLAFSTPAASDAEVMREACAIAARNALVAHEWPPQDGDRQIDEVLAAIRALPLPKAGEGEASPYAPRPNCHTIATFDALLDWMRSVSAGEWTWLRNSVCKYVTIKLDTRAGAYRIEDRNDNSLSLDDLVYQFNSIATPSTEGRKGE